VGDCKKHTGYAVWFDIRDGRVRERTCTLGGGENTDKSSATEGKSTGGAITGGRVWPRLQKPLKWYRVLGAE